MNLKNDMVFIVGLPRTGSTLLRTILNKSERVCITMETHFLHQFSRIGKKKKLNQYGSLQKDANLERLLDAFFSPDNAKGRDFWAWLTNNVDRDEFRRRLCSTDRTDRDIFDLLMVVYTEWKKGAVRDDMVLGEKTSANIYYIPSLMEWYPGMKIIHTFRDPRGIFSSASKLAKAGKWGVRKRVSSLPSLLVEPAIDFGMALYVSKRWRDAVELHQQYQRLYPNRYLLVRFEDLLHDPETHIRRTCEFLQIPFEAGMLEEVDVVGSSYSSQRIVPGGFDPKAADRWREHIHPFFQTWFALLGAKKLKTFGYNP